MNKSISTGIKLFWVVSASIPLAALAQQPGAAPTGHVGMPPIPYLQSLGHTRNVRSGSTPASRAAEAAVEAAKSKQWMADIAHGEALMKDGDMNGAVDAFQQMIAYDPTDGLAYRRMAEAYTAAGKLSEASQAFHKVLIEGFGPGIGNGVGDTADIWAEYALVLIKTNQPAEAVQVYNHAAYALDYEDSENHNGKPYLKMLLPELAAEPTSLEQVRYTPERLQALADTALAHEEKGFGSDKEAIAHMKEAVVLYPDSAPVQYYLGEALPGSYYVFLDSPAKDKAAAWKAYQDDQKATAAAYKKAAELAMNKRRRRQRNG